MKQKTLGDVAADAYCRADHTAGLVLWWESAAAVVVAEHAAEEPKP